MYSLLKVVQYPSRNLNRDDEFVERLHHRYTVLLLVLFAIIGTARIYIGRPIVCWAPAHFRPSHIKYSTSYCWVRNTYYLPFDDDIPQVNERRQEILYYQWIPLIFLSQAALFYFPSIIWEAFSGHSSGIDTVSVIKCARLLRTAKAERKSKTLELLTNQIMRFVGTPRRSSLWNISLHHCLARTLCRPFGKRFGNYLVLLHIFVKCLYIGNVVCQLYLLNAILKTPYNVYGFTAVRDAIMGSDLTVTNSSTVFPKVTMCDFEMRTLGNVIRYTLQCLLPLNMYLEKMFAILWIWMVIVLTISCASLVVWLLRCFNSGDRLAFIRNRLLAARRIRFNVDDEAYLKEFVFDYLRQDGVFLAHLICHNADEITTDEIFGSVWDKWRLSHSNKIQNGSARLLQPEFNDLNIKNDKLTLQFDNGFNL